MNQGVSNSAAKQTGTFLAGNRYFLFLIAAFLIAECIVNPLSNFPLNDDWSYAGAVRIFCNDGSINIGAWPSMSLLTHILWGSLFVKLFGFSFFTLRISTFVALLIGLIFLNRLIIKISNNRPLAALGCALLLFNPMVFNLSNTFMTDVGFNTLVIICCYYAYVFFTTRRISAYVLFVVFSIAITLLRQYGIIFPACFIFCCLFLKEQKLKYVFFGILAFICVAGALKLYEIYLQQTLAAGASYKFSTGIDLLSEKFWKVLVYIIQLRYGEIFCQVFLYAAPFAAIFLPGIFKTFRLTITLSVLLLSGLVIYMLYPDRIFFSENIFSETVVGPETFYRSMSGERHNYYPSLDVVMLAFRFLFSVITLFVLCMGMAGIVRYRAWKKIIAPELLFPVTVTLAYLFMLLITQSFFDRYFIPLIMLSYILFSYFTTWYGGRLSLAIVPLVIMIYISVAGTKDYFEWNRQRQEAYRYLHQEKNIPADAINAGFETSCWQDGEKVGWYDFIHLDGYDYLIQFRSEKGFKLLRSYEFQRYLPYKKDKVNIFIKEGL